MIPKIIHLCWLSGDPYPEKIAKCLASWDKHLPDYEIMLWDTKRFDVNSTAWTKEAFEAHKYAFVADYIRFYAVYNYGGIYLDSDVEVLKPFDDLLDKPYFIGEECLSPFLEVAAFGAEKGTPWVKDAMDFYKGKHFVKEDGSYEQTACPRHMDKWLFSKYKREMISTPMQIIGDYPYLCVLPMEWFCAHKHIPGQGNTYVVTPDTYSVHHFSCSWREFPGGTLQKFFLKLIGKDWHELYSGKFRLFNNS